MTQFVNYEKRKNDELFENLEKFECSNAQNYLPIYNNFFNLTESNFNNINLNHPSHIEKIVKKVDNNLYLCSVMNKNKKSREEKIFFKFAPLIDPVKIMIGKYDNDNTIMKLPSLDSTSENVNSKILDPNNSSYVDGVFSFLSSQLGNRFNFIHGVKYFGSFVAIKKKFKVNVYDDLEYLIKSDYFNKNKNKQFEIENYSDLLEDDSSRDNLPHLKIDHTNTITITDDMKDTITDEMFDGVFYEDKDQVKDCELDDKPSSSFLPVTEVNIQKHNKNSSSNKKTTSELELSDSSCSSRTSHTNSRDEVDDSDDESDDDSDEDSDDESDSDSSSEESEEETIYATFPEFPVQMICMENCENTLDQLILDEELNEGKWLSALLQIIMILITYQKVFSFTHNDLHTNNIMYVSTKKKHLYYQINGKIYKVPTYGKIFKIIDFGRAIYKFNGKTMCSDSFSPSGDAATQYNIEPYYNENKPRLEPNYSFDLCRLACSIFDYLVDDMSEVQDLKKCETITRIIVEWCIDDNGINVLYKNNGADRYPDFKLYKMIARCVHKHTPLAQLERPEFHAFSCKPDKVPKNEYVINIDEISI